MPSAAVTNAPVVASVPPEASGLRRTCLWLSFGLMGAWIVFLAGLTWQTSNPPVVNAVQIHASTYVLVGHWADRALGRFEVADELKHGKSLGTVTVRGVPEHGVPKSSAWVIPVVRNDDAFTVTQGRFMNRPREAASSEESRPWIVQVPPLCYPATDDVLRQVRDILQPTPSRDPP